LHATRNPATALFPAVGTGARDRYDAYQATPIQSGVGSVPIAGRGLPTRHRRGPEAQEIMDCRRTPKGADRSLPWDRGRV